MAPIGRTPLAAALKALRTELAGGPRADLGHDVSELASLLLERELRRFAAVRDPAEQELLASLPDAAALVGKDGRVRVCNAAFDALAAGGKVGMPLGRTFFSPCFGMVTDRFGLGWMVMVPPAA